MFLFVYDETAFLSLKIFPQFIPVGPTHGAGSITFPFLGTWIVGGGVVRAAKGKDLLIGRVWQPLWRGSEKVDSKM